MKKQKLIIVEGPQGTGKTTLVRYLIERLGLNNDQVLFLAFMGKAASQLARNGLPAQTIHSAIYKAMSITVLICWIRLIFKSNKCTGFSFLKIFF